MFPVQTCLSTLGKEPQKATVRQCHNLNRTWSSKVICMLICIDIWLPELFLLKCYMYLATQISSPSASILNTRSLTWWVTILLPVNYNELTMQYNYIDLSYRRMNYLYMQYSYDDLFYRHVHTAGTRLAYPTGSLKPCPSISVPTPHLPFPPVLRVSLHTNQNKPW